MRQATGNGWADHESVAIVILGIGGCVAELRVGCPKEMNVKKHYWHMLLTMTSTYTILAKVEESDNHLVPDRSSREGYPQVEQRYTIVLLPNPIASNSQLTALLLFPQKVKQSFAPIV